MPKITERIRVLDDGRLEVVDPTFSDLPLLQEIDPHFRVETAPLLNFTSPRFQRLRKIGCALTREELSCLGDDRLWNLHDERLTHDGTIAERNSDEASLLDLKIELARRQLTSCNLCAHRCGVNRLNSEVGLCGLGPEAHIGECFPHIAEEPPINPSYLINLYGCGLRCRHCQQPHLLDTSCLIGDPLTPLLWKDVMDWPVRSLSFAGGNPDENLYGILKLLNSAPETFMLPIVWNCHGYTTPCTLKLLEGLIDAFIPDLKHWDDKCGRKLSSAPGYGRVALAAIDQMLAQNVPVLVRILVLPGHIDCCHLPSLDALNQVKTENLFVSIRDQYCPAFLVSPNDGPLARRPGKKEVKAVCEYAFRLGAKFV
jgi:putative pyruvate formate lyase activating enzyme